jgi:hypothetical protein
VYCLSWHTVKTVRGLQTRKAPYMGRLQNSFTGIDFRRGLVYRMDQVIPRARTLDEWNAAAEADRIESGDMGKRGRHGLHLKIGSL